jgi:hypothetical protein
MVNRSKGEDSRFPAKTACTSIAEPHLSGLTLRIVASRQFANGVLAGDVHDDGLLTMRPRGAP